MPFNKNKPFINRLKNDVFSIVLGDEDTLKLPYDDLVQMQEPYVTDLNKLSGYDYYEREQYINTISYLVSFNFAARIQKEKMSADVDDNEVIKNYDLTSLLKDCPIDQQDLDGLFSELTAELSNSEPNYEKYLKDAEDEIEQEDLFQEQKERAEEEEEERLEAEQNERLKQAREKSEKKAEQKEQPELINIPKEDIVETNDSSELINIPKENADDSFETEVSSPSVKQKGQPSQRNQMLDIFENSKTMYNGYKNNKEGVSFTEYVKQNEKETKQDDFSQKMSLLYAGRMCQESRRWFDYINPFKWGPMINENKAVKEIRNEMQTKFGVGDKEMETYDQLYELRNVGLPKDFLYVKKDGQIEISSLVGIPVSFNHKHYIENVKNGKTDITRPDFERTEEPAVDEENREREQLMAQIDKDVNPEKIKNTIQLDMGQKDPTANISDPKIGDV